MELGLLGLLFSFYIGMLVKIHTQPHEIIFEKLKSRIYIYITKFMVITILLIFANIILVYQLKITSLHSEKVIDDIIVMIIISLLMLKQMSKRLNFLENIHIPLIISVSILFNIIFESYLVLAISIILLTSYIIYELNNAFFKKEKITNFVKYYTNLDLLLLMLNNYVIVKFSFYIYSNLGMLDNENNVNITYSYYSLLSCIYLILLNI